MQMQQKVPPECMALSLPDNYEQFVEGINNANYDTEINYNHNSTNTSPRTLRKKQLKVSCSHDKNVRSNKKVNHLV